MNIFRVSLKFSTLFLVLFNPKINLTTVELFRSWVLAPWLDGYECFKS